MRQTIKFFIIFGVLIQLYNHIEGQVVYMVDEKHSVIKLYIESIDTLNTFNLPIYIGKNTNDLKVHCYFDSLKLERDSILIKGVRTSYGGTVAPDYCRNNLTHKIIYGSGIGGIIDILDIRKWSRGSPINRSFYIVFTQKGKKQDWYYNIRICLMFQKE